MAIQSKNSRIGRINEKEDPMFALGKYNPGNVGATWKTGRCKGGGRLIKYDIKSKKRG